MASERRIPAEELVPGDILVLEEGDRVSADARLIEASDVRCDESNLTGEAVPVRKVADAEREAPKTPIQAHNMVFAGSTIISGGGSAVVTATGMRTEFGRIAQLTQAVQPEPSPLQVEVGRVAQRVALLSVAMGVGFFAIGYLVAGLTLRNGAIFAIGIVLANVPEGSAPHDDSGARDGGAADGRAQRHREASVVGGDPRIVHGDLHGQDRHDHQATR